MRWSRFYLTTRREPAADAEAPSHQLMLRAGMIKKLAAGVYTYLPLGWRSLTKLAAIVRREMERAGAVELSLPVLQPAALWRETERWERFGEALFSLEDRDGRPFCLAPTHEEAVTDLVRRDVKSYRQLPVVLYQIQTVFRDEIRPRLGLMRSREFLMKDAYSFHASRESLAETYGEMARAYRRIFAACGLGYMVVEADPGATGGSASQEFMVVAETGDDSLVHCAEDGYAANVERAVSGPLPAAAPEPPAALEEVATPGATSVEEVCRLLGAAPEKLVKTLIYDSDRGVVAVAVRGDRAVNEVKLARLLDAAYVTLAGPAAVAAASGAPVGFAGPVGLPRATRLIADESVRPLTNFVCGANRADAHLRNVNWGRDVEPSEWADVLTVTDGDPSPRGGGSLTLSHGIEVGHIFELGSRYSAAMGATFNDESGDERPMLMGCYGLGLGRTLAAAVEQHHDEDGIVWPAALAPFEVLLMAVNADQPEVVRAADALYAELLQAGVEVFYDDRDERPGVKFTDADLIGIPVRAVVGAKSLAQGCVEISLRHDRKRQPVPRAEVVGRVKELAPAPAAGRPAAIPA